jgi:hypothetical protein
LLTTAPRDGGAQVDKNGELVRLTRALQKESAVSAGEVQLLESEVTRLRDDNVELRGEVCARTMR